MKLNDLRKLLRANNITLYVEGKRYEYEICGLNDKDNTLSEYRLRHCNFIEGDIMFLDYGDYEVDRIEIIRDALMIAIHK